MSQTMQQAQSNVQAAGKQTQQKADAATQQALSRLEFVKSYTEYALNKSYDLAGSAYHTSRSFTPQFLEPRVQAIESKVSELGASYGGPVINTVQDRSSQVLGAVDKQVSCLSEAGIGRLRPFHWRHVRVIGTCLAAASCGPVSPHTCPRSLRSACKSELRDRRWRPTVADRRVGLQVDGVAKRAEQFYSDNASFLADAMKNQSDYHSKNLQHFKDARDAYLSQAKDAGLTPCQFASLNF